MTNQTGVYLLSEVTRSILLPLGCDASPSRFSLERRKVASFVFLRCAVGFKNTR